MARRGHWLHERNPYRQLPSGGVAREKLPDQLARIDFVTGCEVAGTRPDMAASLGERRIGPVKDNFGARSAWSVTNLGNVH